MGTTQAQQSAFLFQRTPVKHVLLALQEQTAIRFLYRDALIAGKQITLTSSKEALVPSLQEALHGASLDLHYDSLNQQVLIFERRQGSKPAFVRGHVLDRESGFRLPHATISWKTDGVLQGVTSNDAGSFLINMNQFEPDRQTIELTVSFLGYADQFVSLQRAAPPEELSIRLIAEPIREQEVIINGSILQSNLDPSFHDLMSAAIVAPLGEKSIMHSLQLLPSVAVNSAFSNGLNVRGSKADGFQVLLDGSTIYNQNHFFGLFDVFNADALRSVGFYHDITPAHYAAPPGGTLHFVTRTGSLYGLAGEVGLSSTAVRATFEGPIMPGRASWLVSGRHSYIDGLQWLNNQELVNQGLDIRRNMGGIPDPFVTAESIELRPENSEARFYDLHTRFYHENARASRIIGSFYLGGNYTLYNASRLELERQDNNQFLQIGETPVQTNNIWWNQAASIESNTLIGERFFLRSQTSVSHYYSGYRKDDFTYTSRTSTTAEPRIYIFPFEFKNRLLNLKWNQFLEYELSQRGTLSGGYALQYYAINYEEKSATRPDFGQNYYAMQADVFAHHNVNLFNRLKVETGIRSHYFTQGNRFKWSPRLQLQYKLTDALSIKGGYSKNFQFLHHLFLNNTHTPSIWIMTTGASSPTAVHNVTTGIYYKPAPGTMVQLEGYLRNYKHVRRHEINAPIEIASVDNARLVPWFSDNELHSAGLEWMYRQRLFNRVVWTNSYAWSRVDITNETVNGGNPFAAEWDRRHQFMTQFEVPLFGGISLNTVWVYASGSPNPLAYDDVEEPPLLSDYHRLDAGLRGIYNGKKLKIKGRLSFYNVYDNNNTWTREAIQVYDSERPATGLRFLNADVYDLGFQPSFDLSVAF